MLWPGQWVDLSGERIMLSPGYQGIGSRNLYRSNVGCAQLPSILYKKFVWRLLAFLSILSFGCFVDANGLCFDSRAQMSLKVLAH